MRILVVEDEKRLAAGLQADGFAADVAHTGVDGLRFAGGNAYNAILLDIMLPGLNGYKVCEALRDEVEPGDLRRDPSTQQVWGGDIEPARPFGRDSVTTIRGAGHRLDSDGG